MGNDFLRLPERQLAKRLKELGHRFPNARARYISQSINCKNELSKQGLEELKQILTLLQNKKEFIRIPFRNLILPFL